MGRRTETMKEAGTGRSAIERPQDGTAAHAHATTDAGGPARLRGGWRARTVPALVAAAAMALATGCGGARALDNPVEGAGGQTDDIEILVRNLKFNQVTVYTSQSGSVRRLGSVPGKGEATFTVRWHLPHIQLRVRELAGPDYLTETLPVGPGELLELIIPAY